MRKLYRSGPRLCDDVRELASTIPASITQLERPALLRSSTYKRLFLPGVRIVSYLIGYLIREGPSSLTASEFVAEGNYFSANHFLLKNKQVVISRPGLARKPGQQLSFSWLQA